MYRMVSNGQKTDVPTLNEATDLLFAEIDTFPISTRYDLYSTLLNGKIETWEIVGTLPSRIFPARLAFVYQLPR